MTDDKPDALEELRLLGDTTDRICAAWEKERAGSAKTRDNLALQCVRLEDGYSALRAAVEKVRDELRADLWEQTWEARQRLADALDAALRGGT